jgi:hypothetical protein
MSNGLLHDISISDAVQGAAAMPSIPREAILDTVPRSALAATKKIVNLVPITSGTVGPNQTIQFLIPQRNLMKASSVYLKFKFSIPATASSNEWSFSGGLGSCAAVFNNITLQAGGVVLESMQNYHLWHNNILSNAHQGNDELAIESLCAGTKLVNTATGQYVAAVAAAGNGYDQQSLGYAFQGTNTGGGSATATASSATFATTRQFPAPTSAFNAIFTMPILSGVFNPKESQLIPLQFINGGILLTLQTNAVSKTFFEFSNVSPAVSTLTNYEISDLELCYAEITPAPEYVLRIREEMMAGKMIKIECQSYQQYNVASGSTVRQNFNVNLSSVASIFWGRVFDPDATTTSKYFQGFGTDADANIRYEVYLDNVLLFNSPNQLNCMAVQVRQLQEALASSVSDYQISPFTAARGNNASYVASTFLAPVNNGPVATRVPTADNTFYTSNMLWGLSTKLFASNSTSMDGTPVGVLTINFATGQGQGTSGASNEGTSNLWYIYVVYDYIYLVDATGSVSKNQ